MAELSKTYDPKPVESRWYATWRERGDFRARPESGRPPYTIVIPPPNVTGILHMGHALNNTIQDVLVRWKRMQGFDAVWIPGTDHASIATEQKVVAALEQQGVAKRSLSRETFLGHAWAWKEKYGGIIIGQLERMGCSCDWERERFTMDPGYSRAVLEAFVRLYHKGLIHRGHRLVNWCPVSRSAISDEEVVHREVRGKLWHFRYPRTDGMGSVVVATTRPETMLGDTAVAVNPKDSRYQDLIGKTVKLPLAGREIPVIADEFVDPAFGTGCVKVTPAHDPNDFAMGERHGLVFINIMNDDASLNDRVPEAYRGLSREAARKRVVADLEALGLMERIEDYINQVGYSQRGDVPIEFYMSEQWFMRMDELARPAREAVLDGRIRIHPAHWVKTYLHWLDNIQEWCISRQLWWGHRIPVWYRKGADRSDPEARHVSVEGPPDPEHWEQDEDVLDTWASSWLWPFAVHTWPEDSEALRRYYPTDVLATGPDILFFWVARMVMAGLEFMGDIPFTDVCLHGIVRDDDGRKMSKSLGNSLDPLEIIETYSADALRFSLMMLTAPGQDVQVAPQKFELGRNFATKIWNAARFIQMQNEGLAEAGDAWRAPDWTAADLSREDRWLLGRLQTAAAAATRGLEEFRFDAAASAIYEFVWRHYCDWYVEAAKTALNAGDPVRRTTTLKVLHYGLASALRLLHPFMPFLTEELWHGMGYAAWTDTIQFAPWPDPAAEATAGGWTRDEAVETAVEARHELVRLARNLKAEYGIPTARRARFVVKPHDPAAEAAYREDADVIASLLRAENLDVDPDHVPAGATPSALGPDATVYMPLAGVIDVEAERTRQRAKLEELDANLKRANHKLLDRTFLDKAPEKVVAQFQARRDELADQRAKLARLVAALEG